MGNLFEIGIYFETMRHGVKQRDFGICHFFVGINYLNEFFREEDFSFSRSILHHINRQRQRNFARQQESFVVNAKAA